MKEILFLLEELLRLVFHQNADSSIKDFRLGVKSGPREGQRPRFGKKRCSSPKLLSFGTAFTPGYWTFPQRNVYSFFVVSCPLVSLWPSLWLLKWVATHFVASFEQTHFLFVYHHLFHVCMLIICRNQFHLNIHSWKGDNQIGLRRFETIIAFNNYD